jgi:hypothetical protein
MRKALISLLLAAVALVCGCEALTMTPDAWLDPVRWEEAELAKVQLEQ